MDLVAWRGKAKGGQLRSFLDSTNRSAYRIKYKQGSLLTLPLAARKEALERLDHTYIHTKVKRHSGSD